MRLSAFSTEFTAQTVHGQTPRLELDDNPEFNEWIDQGNNPVQIFALPPYRPSEVLFNVDQEAYRDLLAQYDDEDEPAVGGDDVTSGEGSEAIQ